jgi:hypothetical protein
MPMFSVVTQALCDQHTPSIFGDFRPDCGKGQRAFERSMNRTFAKYRSLYPCNATARPTKGFISGSTWSAPCVPSGEVTMKIKIPILAIASTLGLSPADYAQTAEPAR